MSRYIMKITSRIEDQTLVLALQGRLDAFHGGELQKVIDQNLSNQQVICVIMDMSGVDYLSSAGLRVILALYKNLRKRDGVLALAGLQDYCRDVIEMAGFAPTLPQFVSADEALEFCRQVTNEKRYLENWDKLETFDAECGTFRFIPGSREPGAVLVMGDVKDVLYSRVSVDHLCSKKFSETEYSIGLGGMGNQLEDYFPIMGEMMTIGGTMVWLPTDGHDTPDFLIPKKDTGQVNLANQLTDTIQLERLGKLLYTLAEIIMGLMLTFFIGILTLRSIYGSVMDALTLRTGKFVTDTFFPVIGGYLSDALETAAGYVVLLKQAVGILGLLTIFGIFVFPILKIGVIALIYKVSAALVEPLGDKRISQVLEIMGNHLFLALASVAAVGLMFFILVAILVSTGNSVILLR
jgi:anti-anti-sigma factor